MQCNLKLCISNECSVAVSVLLTDVGVPEEQLQASLGAIEEITGMLTVRNSYALTSLRFLRRLRLINGTDHQSNDVE